MQEFLLTQGDLVQGNVWMGKLFIFVRTHSIISVLSTLYIDDIGTCMLIDFMSNNLLQLYEIRE